MPGSICESKTLTRQKFDGGSKMQKTPLPLNGQNQNRLTVKDYFIRTGFYDLLPLALQIAKELGYTQSEIIEAICKVSDKFFQYPPTKNRTAWFKMVFREKLTEARADILAFKAEQDWPTDWLTDGFQQQIRPILNSILVSQSVNTRTLSTVNLWPLKGSTNSLLWLDYGSYHCQCNHTVGQLGVGWLRCSGTDMDNDHDCGWIFDCQCDYY